MNERVLVVPRTSLLRGHESLCGFLPSRGEEFLEIASQDGFFALRSDVEGDPGLKQIIPYGMLLRGESVFVMRRSRKGGDPRLYDRVTLGVGGHVNPPDAAGADLRNPGVRNIVEAAFERELREELVVEGPLHSEIVGVLNDDSNPVGAVHFGIVYRVLVETSLVRVREEDVLSGEFVPVGGLSAYRESMETWSRILQEHFWPT